MIAVRLIEPLGERPLQEADFPLTIGGPGAAVLLPGCVRGEVLARIAWGTGQPSIEPASPAVDLRSNDRRLSGPTALQEGDVIALGGAR